MCYNRFNNNEQRILHRSAIRFLNVNNVRNRKRSINLIELLFNYRLLIESTKNHKVWIGSIDNLKEKKLKILSNFINWTSEWKLLFWKFHESIGADRILRNKLISEQSKSSIQMRFVNPKDNHTTISHRSIR